MQGFRWRDFDAYLFDIDGTLLNSRDGVHYNAFHDGLREAYGCELRIDNVPVHGNTDIGILQATTRLAGIDEATFRKNLAAAISAICSSVQHNASGMNPELCPSVRELLGELKNAGKVLGVTSGNLEPIGWTKLRAAGIAEYFSFGSFSDRNETRVEIFRYGAQRARELSHGDAAVCFIGDTPNDIDAAHALDLPVIAVATGIYSREALLEHAPELCIGCCDELFSATDGPAT